MTTGIYLWMVNRPGKVPLVYVGQAVDIEKRRAEYLAAWNRGVQFASGERTNLHLFRAVKKYGPDAVEFRVLELCSKDELLDREQYWYDRMVEQHGRDNVANAVRPQPHHLQDPSLQERRLEGLRRVQATDEHRAKMVANLQAARTPEACRKKAAALSREFALVSPDGELYRGRNVTQFAREHGLQQCKLSEVLAGKRSHHKGWRAL